MQHEQQGVPREPHSSLEAEDDPENHVPGHHGRPVRLGSSTQASASCKHIISSRCKHEPWRRVRVGAAAPDRGLAGLSQGGDRGLAHSPVFSPSVCARGPALTAAFSMMTPISQTLSLTCTCWSACRSVHVNESRVCISPPPPTASHHAARFHRETRVLNGPCELCCTKPVCTNSLVFAVRLTDAGEMSARVPIQLKIPKSTAEFYRPSRIVSLLSGAVACGAGQEWSQSL